MPILPSFFPMKVRRLTLIVLALGALKPLAPLHAQEVEAPEPPQAPTALALNRNVVAENQPAGTYVGSFITTDVNAKDTFKYSLVGGDTSAFTIAAASLRTAVPLDSKKKNRYEIKVRTTDSGGLFFEQSFTIAVVEASPPTITLDSPAFQQKLLFPDFSGDIISGKATDNVGIQSFKARLSRKRNGSNQYWNGTEFVTPSIWLEVKPQGGQWTLSDKLPPADKLDTGPYQVEVYATDAAGNKSTRLVRTFSLGTDFLAPTVSISTPTDEQAVDIDEFKAGTITGTTEDNVGVTAIKVKVVRKRGTKYHYWNGTEFTTNPATVDATLNGTKWSLDSPIPSDQLDEGLYAVYALAYDAVGNYKTSPSRLFRITDAP